MTLERSDGGSSGANARRPDAMRAEVFPSIGEMALSGLGASRASTPAGGGPAARDDGGAPSRVRVDVLRPWGDEDSEVYLEWLVFGIPSYAEGEPAGWAEATVAQLIPHPGALGDYLEKLPPGERLGKVLAAIDADKVDDFSLVEVVAAYKRMEAWAAAKAARAAAVLAERPAVNPTWPGSVPGRTQGECVVGHEVSMRLRISRMTAINMVAAGRAFGGMFEPTGQALENGLIDYARAMAIVTTLLDLPAEVAMAAQWEVLDKAPGRTLRQVQQDLAKAVIAVDPDSADDRHRAARKKRRVNHPRPLRDGMAHISAVLPATDAVALDTALEAAARAAKNNGDGRTIDQLRADCLALMGQTALALGHIGPHPAMHCTCAGCTPRHAEPTGVDPAERSGDDHPVPASPQSSGSASGTPGAPTSGVLSTTAPVDPPAPAPGAPASVDPPVPGPTTPGTPASVDPPVPGTPASVDPPVPGPSVPGTLASVHPPVPAPSTSDAAGTSAAPPARSNPGSSSSSRCCCSSPLRTADGPPHPGHRLPGGLLPLIKLGTLAGGRADVRITVPLNVLLPDEAARELSALERDPEPVAELEGYGPICPLLARALSAGGVWRRLVTDPVTEQVLDFGRIRYQPPAALADYVRERDRTCIRPSCSAPARTADLDHIHEWHDGGVTSGENLGPLCTSDHPVKSIGAYTVAYGSDRTYAWTTPTGHGYLRRPDGTTITLPRRTAEGLRTACKDAARRGRRLDPATVDAVLAEISAGTDVGGTWAPRLGSRAAAWPGTQEGPSWMPEDAPPF